MKKQHSTDPTEGRYLIGWAGVLGRKVRFFFEKHPVVAYIVFGGTSAGITILAAGKAGTGTTCKYWRLFY